MAKLIITLGLLLVAGFFGENGEQQRRQAFIDNFNYSQHLDKRLAKRHPGSTEAQRKAVLIALQDYFQMCRLAGRRMVAMPSPKSLMTLREFILSLANMRNFVEMVWPLLAPTPAEVMRTQPMPRKGLSERGVLASASMKVSTQNNLSACLVSLRLMVHSQLPGGFLYQQLYERYKWRRCNGVLR